MSMRRNRIYKRMYAVSHEGVGIIAGTMAYSRKNAIDHFLCGSGLSWEVYKRSGHRTVMAQVKILPRSPQETAHD